MTETEIKKKLKQFYPHDDVSIKDLTGTQNHYEVQIISDQFSKLSHVERHRSVMKIFEKELKEKSIHALSLKLRTKP